MAFQLEQQHAQQVPQRLLKQESGNKGSGNVGVSTPQDNVVEATANPSIQIKVEHLTPKVSTSVQVGRKRSRFSSATIEDEEQGEDAARKR